MELKGGLQRTEVLNVEETRRYAEQVGFFTFVLPARGVVDRASFFDAVRATFPLDPPLVGFRSWDALSDSLWEGLYTHEARRIAILWPGATAMGNAAPSDFEIALHMLADVANLLADRQATCAACRTGMEAWWIQIHREMGEPDGSTRVDASTDLGRNIEG